MFMRADLQPHAIAIAGNPNSGKSAFFNLLTGSQQKIANFPGVTVEKKEGFLQDSDDRSIKVIDLPGTYSLDAASPDEIIAQQILLGLRDDTERPETILVIVDSTHLERSLFLISQLMEFGLKVVLCLNMYDIAEKKGIVFDLSLLSRLLHMPVVPTVAIEGKGKQEVAKILANTSQLEPSRRPFRMSAEIEQLRREIADDLVQKLLVPEREADFWAGKIISGRLQSLQGKTVEMLTAAAKKWQPKIEQLCPPNKIATQEIEQRYRWIEEICQKIIIQGGSSRSLSDKIDRIVLHRLFGPVIFIAVMTLIFQAVFSWAEPLMDLIDSSMGLISTAVVYLLPASVLRDLLVEGVIGGVGSVIIFMPQIMILFFFIGLLEASGYLARAAFLVDRLMVRSGLTGKSFIPLLSSFACAIPGIMATRTIKNERDRLTTIMVAPLMTCSARLPVYALLIGAFVPAQIVYGLRLQGVVLFGLYLLGMVGAVVAAKVFRQTLLKGERSTLILELPDYKRPQLRHTLRYLWTRTKLFLFRAGKIILAMSIVMWFLASFPKNQEQSIEHSYAGQIGHVIEPVIAPLGFDWKIGVGLLASFAAREVFVATMGTLYNIEDADETSISLQQALKQDRNEQSGQLLFNLPMVLALLVFFVFAMQCMSTVAIMRRESNSWKWPLLAIVYTYVLAYGLAWVTYQVTDWLVV